MAKFIRHRENSRTDWGCRVEGDNNPNIEHIKLGCLLRIADGVETMAKSYTDMERDRNLYRDLARDERAESERLARSNRALRGYIKRVKKGT